VEGKGKGGRKDGERREKGREKESEGKGKGMEKEGRGKGCPPNGKPGSANGSTSEISAI